MNIKMNKIIKDLPFVKHFSFSHQVEMNLVNGWMFFRKKFNLKLLIIFIWEEIFLMVIVKKLSLSIM